MSWLKSLLRLGSRARLVGTDLNGNQYFEIAARGQRQRPRRSVTLKGIREDQYTQESVPPEWDRWLRGLTNDPPTHEEQVARVRQSQTLKQRILQVERKDAELQAQGEESSTARVSPRVKAVEHAAAPSFVSKAETSEEPTSTGKTFQPASWKPN